MRVLRIHNWNGVQAGGAEAYIRTISRMLNSRGHPQRLLTISEARSDYFGDGIMDVPVAHMGFGRAMGDGFGMVKIEEALKSCIRDFTPDIIQLHHFDPGFASIGRVLDRCRIPIVYSAHDSMIVCPIATLVLPDGTPCDGGIRFRCGFTGCKVGFGLPYDLWKRELFDRLVLPHVKAFLCSSRALTRYLDNNGYRPAVHLPSFAEIPTQVMDASAIAHRGDASTIGYMGRLEPYKGVDILLRAVAMIVSSGHDLSVDIAGDGSSKADLLDLSRTLGIERSVNWSGWVSGERKESWFQRQRLLAMPSRPFEIFGLVALEALVREVPVVAADAGGVCDIVRDGKTGRLVPHSDPPALAKAITEMLEDPQMSQRLASNGRKMVLSEFTPEVHLERLIAIYERVLSK